MHQVTFDIPGSKRAREPMRSWNRERGFKKVLSGHIEGIYESDAIMVASTDVHPFALAAHDAFYDHYPMTLTPDAVWFCIAQGFARHVNLNAETLRKRFVRHEGKVKLVVERPDFHLGQKNPWPEVFGSFSDQIASHVGKLRELVVADFSTTGPLERAASEVLLMDTFQAYFEYEMRLGCGIPSFTLLGTPDDWSSVKQRASFLAEYGLEHWLAALLPVLDQCIDAAHGRPDIDFWRSFFRYQSGSGPSELTGWIHTLYPYITDGTNPDKLIPNPYMAQWHQGWTTANNRAHLPLFEIVDGFLQGPVMQGPAIQQLPSGLASAPVKLHDLAQGGQHEAQFVGGMFGVIQDPETLSLQPEFGWAIVLPEAPNT